MWTNHPTCHSLFLLSWILTIQHGRALVFGLVVCSTTTSRDQSRLRFTLAKSRHNSASVNVSDTFYTKISTALDGDTTAHAWECSYVHKGRSHSRNIHTAGGRKLTVQHLACQVILSGLTISRVVTIFTRIKCQNIPGSILPGKIWCTLSLPSPSVYYSLAGQFHVRLIYWHLWAVYSTYGQFWLHTMTHHR